MLRMQFYIMKFNICKNEGTQAGYKKAGLICSNKIMNEIKKYENLPETQPNPESIKKWNFMSIYTNLWYIQLYNFIM